MYYFFIFIFFNDKKKDETWKGSVCFFVTKIAMIRKVLAMH